MTPPTIEAVNRYGHVVRTFGARDLATDYRDRMALIGCPITLRIARVQRRTAA